MLYQLIMLEKYTDNSVEIMLDDFTSGSSAVYRLKNPNGLNVGYCCPDRAEESRVGSARKNRDKQRKEPRCDYLLYVAQLKLVKFVELKGVDSKETEYSCCSTSWEHGFHQLEATYDAYRIYLNQEDTISFVLCTALTRNRINSRYRNYIRYRRLREVGKVLILGRDEWEELTYTAPL